MIVDGLGCASCAGTCGGDAPEQMFSGIGALGCDAGYTFQNGACYANWDARSQPTYTPPTYAQWAAANPVLAAQLNPTSYTDPNKCPAGYEWDGLAGLGSLDGCRPNAQTLAAQAALVQQQAAAQLALQQAAQAELAKQQALAYQQQQQQLAMQLAAQQQAQQQADLLRAQQAEQQRQIQAQAAAAALALSRQCQPGYEWDGLDGLSGLSGCRKIVVTAGGVPVPTVPVVPVVNAPIDLGVQPNWFTTTGFFGLPNWQLVAGAGGLLVLWKELKG